MQLPPRKYYPIWDAIKKAPVGTEVQVKCHATAARTLRQAVLKEKSIETAAAKKLGMPYAGELEIREEEGKPTGYMVVFFKLSWDGRRL